MLFHVHSQGVVIYTDVVAGVGRLRAE
jgi:hypothetical protein